MKLTGIILAGGRSSRMGTDKGLIPFKGKLMIQHIIDTLESMNLSIIIISNNDKYEQFGYPVYEDLVSEKGPIGGIYTALHYSTTENNVIVSCDTPFVSSLVLEKLIETSEKQMVTIPEFMGRQHPLIGVYSKQAIHVFKDHLDKDQLKLKVANEDLNVNIVSMNETPKVMAMMFNNINTKEELNILEL